MFMLRNEQMLVMKHNIWAVPRETFCWLDETQLVIKSHNKVFSNGHAELIDIVSSTLSGLSDLN